MNVRLTILDNKLFQRRAVLWLAVSAVALLVAFVGVALRVQADDVTASPAQVSLQLPMSFLEGKTFAGELGLLGEPAMTKDLLVFRDGMFISKECEKRCGYAAGPYWVRSVEEGVQVRAETPCLKSDASIVWNGTVKGDQIEGTFTWTSRRWYWTIEKEFWFNGKLVESDVTLSE